MDYHEVPQSSGNGAGKRKALEGIGDRVIYVLALEPLLQRLSDEGANPAL